VRFSRFIIKTMAEKEKLEREKTSPSSVQTKSTVSSGVPQFVPSLRHRSSHVPELPKQLAEFQALAEIPSVVSAMDAVNLVNKLLVATDGVTVVTSEASEAYEQAQAALVEELCANIEASLDPARGVKNLARLWEVMTVSDHRFFKAYSGVRDASVREVNLKHFDTFIQELGEFEAEVSEQNLPCAQTKTKALDLVVDAINLLKPFTELVLRLSSGDGLSGEVGPVKKLSRMVEKTVLRAQNLPTREIPRVEDARSSLLDFSSVLDIRRGFVEAHTTSDLTAVLHRIRAEQVSGTIKVVRIKDRFSNPSTGGWADCMVNFYFSSDPLKHICELQLVHSAMMTVRKELGGHLIYTKGRNACELLELAAASSPLGAAIPFMALKAYMDEHGFEVPPAVSSWGDWTSEEELQLWDGVVVDDRGQPDVLGTLFSVLGGQFDGPTFSAALFLGMPQGPVNFRPLRHVASDELLEVIGAYCPLVSSVNLDTCRGITDKGLAALARGCPRISWVNLQFCNHVTAQGGAEMLKLCPKLEPDKMLPLAASWKCGGVLDALASHHSNIRCLTLQGCRHVNDAGLESLAACRCLEKLDIGLCMQVTDAGIIAVARSCTVLRHFSFRNLSKVTDASFEALGSFCDSLEFLDAAFVKVSDKGVAKVAMGCNRLQEVDLTGCMDIGNDSMRALGDHCPNLRAVRVDCRGVEDEGLAYLQERCPRLVSNAVGSVHKGDHFLVAAAKVHGAGLVDLNLAQSTAVGDRGLFHISEACPGLQNLDLSNCIAITETGIGSIAKGCSQLRLLRLAYCHRIANTALRSLGEHSASLTDLDLSYCPRVSDPGVEALSCCKSLCLLRLSYCERISDFSLKCLSNGCPELRSISLIFCLKISDEGMSYLAARNHKLEEILLEGTAVTEVGERQLRTIIPNRLLIER